MSPNVTIQLSSGRTGRFSCTARFDSAPSDASPRRKLTAAFTVRRLRRAYAVSRSSMHVVTMVEDITNLQLLERQLKHQTLHDLQTDLPNRQYFITHLEEVLARLAPSAVVTLLHLDLDGFSTINDGLGRPAGDFALNVVARRLAGVVADRPAMVARLSADEFAILIEPGDAPLDIAALIESINTELGEPFYLDDTGVALTATVGVVQCQAGQFSPDGLMRAASTTLRRVRGANKRQWALF